MKPLNEIYGKRFFGKRYKLHWRAPHVCKAIYDVLEPQSVVDVGCATGDLVLCWREQFAVDAWGIEGDPSCLDHVVTDQIDIQDLRILNPILRGRFDLATCFEVAEHIEPEYASIFVKNLVNLSDKLLVSLAPPGQGGHYHVNCQPIEYWVWLFQSFGYELMSGKTEVIRQGMSPWKHKDGIKAFYKNLALFERR